MFEDMFDMFADTFKSMTITEVIKILLECTVAFGTAAIIAIIAACI